MKKIIFLVFTLFEVVNLYAQEATGLPFITYYSPVKTHYNLSPDWILQGNKGIMYFGTIHAPGRSIMQYDGVSWTPVINKNDIRSTTRAAAKDKSGTIFYGGSGDLGYLSRDSIGRTVCISLLQYVPKNKREFGDIFSVQAAGSSVYFQTRRMLFRLTKTGAGKNPGWICKTWESKSDYGNIFYLGSSLYVQDFKRGLLKLVNDSLQLIPGSEIFNREYMIAMLPYSDSTKKNKSLIGTTDDGLYLFDGKQFNPFPTQADQWIKEVQLSQVVPLNEGNYALAIPGKGAVIINSQGNILQVIDKESGLKSNSVYSLFWDDLHNLWIVTDKGIYKAELNLPFTTFFNQAGLPSSVEGMAKLPDGSLYAGMTRGVAKYNPGSSQFEIIPTLANVGDVLMITDGSKLLEGGSGGLYAIDGNKVSQIIRYLKPDALLISKVYPNLLYAGTYLNGLAVFVRDLSHTGGWRLTGFVPGTWGETIHAVAEQRDGKLWLRNDYSTILSRLTFHFDKNGLPDLKKTTIEKFEAGKAFPGHMSMYAFKNKVYFLDDSSFTYTLNEPLQKFERDTVLLAAGDTLGGFVQGVNNLVWASSKKGEYNYYTSESGERYRIDTSLLALTDNYGATARFPGGNGIIWISALDGLIRFDTKIPFRDSLPFNALIRRITFGKTALNPNQTGNHSPELKFSHDAFRFDFAAPYFLNEDETQYQIFLQGFDTAWSDWSKVTFKEYTNLPYGKYVFKVRAKNVLGAISPGMDYSFIIHPPWYRTWWAYLIYALIGIGIVRGLITYRSRNLKRKNQLLEQKVSQRTDELKQSLDNLRSTQKQLIQSEKMASLGELTAGIAHEIQNPLNFVNNFSEVNKEMLEELKAERLKPNAERDDALQNELVNDVIANEEKIIHHGKRADAIVKGMLQHSRTSSGQKEPTDINALCDEYLRLAYHGLRAKDKSFNANYKTDFDNSLSADEAGIGKINVVPQDIGRVLLNLFNNAFYACAERSRSAVNERHKAENSTYAPTVKIVTKKLNDKVEITVQDNGNGIPQNIIEKIFQPFFTTKPTGEGTGLGLSLAYDIVKAHGGEINVETKEGEGTEFIIQLPTV